MRWDESHESPDLVDRRGERGGGGGGGLSGLIGLLPFLIRSPLGWLVLLVAGGYYLYQNFAGSSGDTRAPASQHAVGDPRAQPRGDDARKHFVASVLDDVQTTWTTLLGDSPPYRHAKLVLFTGATETGCGYGRSATGPFYCPQDERAYIDLSFFQELEGRLGAKGDFAQAYVIAHEIGHHVQKVLGVTARVQRLRGVPSEGETGTSVRVELQADCFAGIWAHSTAQRNLLEGGDLDEALGAAAAVGDDRLQRQATGTVSPETWTHGSSKERARWFSRGYDSGDIKACDTLAAREL
jgi:predicted metalloprotease